MIEDLLSAMVGIEGKYVCVRRGRHKEGNSFYYQLEPSLDASLSVRFSGLTCFWNYLFVNGNVLLKASIFLLEAFYECSCI